MTEMGIMFQVVATERVPDKYIYLGQAPDFNYACTSNAIIAKVKDSKHKRTSVKQRGRVCPTHILIDT